LRTQIQEGLKKNPKDTDLENLLKEVKNFSSDCYYQMTYCTYMYAKDQKTPDKRQTYLSLAARSIAQMKKQGGDGWAHPQERFEQLLKSDRDLDNSYKAQLKSS